MMNSDSVSRFDVRCYLPYRHCHYQPSSPDTQNLITICEHTFKQNRPTLGFILERPVKATAFASPMESSVARHSSYPIWRALN